MLKLRAEGYTWKRHTCSLATKKGHWGVLKWAVENGCPLSYNSLRTARKFYRSEPSRFTSGCCDLKRLKRACKFRDHLIWATTHRNKEVPDGMVPRTMC